MTHAKDTLSIFASLSYAQGTKLHHYALCRCTGSSQQIGPHSAGTGLSDSWIIGDNYVDLFSTSELPGVPFGGGETRSV